MKRLLLSAFACDPTKGSEPGYGWNWAIGLAAEGYEVHCLTRAVARKTIEKTAKPQNVYFHYVRLPLGLERLYFASQPTMYLYYILWQWKAYKTALRLHKQTSFDLAHHVTWGSLQMGSFLYRLNIPLIFGPAGGGQKAPEAFKDYFGRHWHAEQKREAVTKWMLRANPACRQMLKKANMLLVANNETLAMAKVNGAVNTSMVPDVALPDSFYPQRQMVKSPSGNQLRLLWTGRFLPRKGILLLLDVMKALKEYPGITLTVVGDGEMRDAFLNKLREYKLEATVDWKGKVPYEAIRDHYAGHDVFFYTSLRDSGSLQLLEAMAFGLPVVCLHLHGQAIIVDDTTGIRCKCDTPETAIENLKQAIIYLYNHPDKVRKMSEAAYNFAARQKWQHKIGAIVNQYYPK
jgi:glycosyltransferase involved in cell wall biosynthesis